MNQVAAAYARPSFPLPKLSEIAHTIVSVDLADEKPLMPGFEAWEAQMEGAYTDYYVCPAGTDVLALEVDDDDDGHAQVVHEGNGCVVIGVIHS